MCRHDEFDVLYYKHGVMIRKCVHCGQVEVQTEYWTDISHVQEAVEPEPEAEQPDRNEADDTDFDTPANLIVDGILTDLSDRGGLSDEWDMIDDDIRAEIVMAWQSIAKEIFERWS